MTSAETDQLVRRFIGGDPAAPGCLADRAVHSTEPVLLVAAAVAGVAAPDLLARAATSATTTRDRQLVAIASAHLAGDTDRVDALAREHLVDHPDSILVAWLAATPKTPPVPAKTQETS